MINRTVHMIFEPSGQPFPSEEEVQFEAQEIVSRFGWGLPFLEALREVRDPYWREAVARCLMEYWQKLVRDKDEQTYYYDSDGDIRYCWKDAEYDFNRIIRRSTIEQVDQEQAMHMEASVEQVNILVCGWNNRRERRGLSRINFARRLLDENEWRKGVHQHGVYASVHPQSRSI